MVTTLAGAERAALCDLLERSGPDAPTLCGDWTTRDLAAHLVVRERRPDSLPGIRIRALTGHTESVQASYAGRDYAELVRLVRTGPGLLSPFALPGVDTALNTTEYAVHHEDVRRAATGWEPRRVPATAQDSFWKVVSARSAMTFRSLGCRVELRRSDRPEADAVSRGSGESTVVLTGEPLEMLMFVFGRREHALVEVSGDPEAVAALNGADLGV